MKKKFHLIDYARDNKMHTVTEEFLLQFYDNDMDTNNSKIEDYIKKCKPADHFVCERHNYSLICLAEVENTNAETIRFAVEIEDKKR